MLLTNVPAEGAPGFELLYAPQAGETPQAAVGVSMGPMIGKRAELQPAQQTMELARAGTPGTRKFMGGTALGGGIGVPAPLALVPAHPLPERTRPGRVVVPRGPEMEHLGTPFLRIWTRNGGGRLRLLQVLA